MKTFFVILNNVIFVSVGFIVGYWVAYEDAINNHFTDKISAKSLNGYKLNIPHDISYVREIGDEESDYIFIGKSEMSKTIYLEFDRNRPDQPFKEVQLIRMLREYQMDVENENIIIYDKTKYIGTIKNSGEIGKLISGDNP